jgi:hypothetical protein
MLPGITEVFGVGSRGLDTRFRLDWLNPLGSICFPASVRDEIMGFCRPCTRPIEALIHPFGNNGDSLYSSTFDSTHKDPGGLRSVSEIV